MIPDRALCALHMHSWSSSPSLLTKKWGSHSRNASDYYNDGYYWSPENRLRQNPFDLLNASVEWD